MKQVFILAIGLMLLACVILQFRVIRRYRVYVLATEILLDRIAADDDTFLDVVGETDEYRDYVLAIEGLDD